VYQDLGGYKQEQGEDNTADDGLSNSHMCDREGREPLASVSQKILTVAHRPLGRVTVSSHFTGSYILVEKARQVGSIG
jgi:hypothetical protein